MTGGRQRAGVVVVGMLALAPLTATLPRAHALPTPPPPAGSSPATAPTPPLQVRLATLRPLVPQPGDTITLTGTVHNVSAASLANPSIQLRLGPAVVARGTFDAYAADPTGGLPFEVSGDATSVTPLGTTRLAPGATARFSLAVPVDQLGLPTDAWQVREIGLVATALSTTGAVTGTLRSFLPWAPSQAGGGSPIRVAWVWPLVDRPHRGVHSDWLDADLAPELAAGGRLAQLVSAAADAQAQRSGRHAASVTSPVPVTFAIDPMLVEDAEEMTGNYSVATATGPRPGPGAQTARSWLAALRATAGRSEIIPLPYADPDVVAAARARLTTDIGVAVTSGKTILDRALPQSTLLSTGWLPGGMTDQRATQALYAAGVTSLVLSDAALPVVPPPPSETPGATAALATDGGQLKAALVDSGLSAAVAGGVGPGADPRLALQRFLSETLMIHAEAPNDPRSVVVAPDRRWDPLPGFARALLTDTGRVPWIQPVTLGSVLAEPVYDRVTRAPLTYPPTARHQELPGAYLRNVAALQSAVDTFAAILLPPGDATIRSYNAAVERDLSSAYRGDPQRDQRIGADQAAVAAAMHAVHITSQNGSFVTLTSHQGSVPVTIANDLGTDVRVVLQVEPNQRITPSHDGRVAQVIPAHGKVTVDVHAAAKTSGVFPLSVRLLTPGPGGHPYGDLVRLNVRSTVYGTITIVITAAATAALLIAVAVRLTRRGLAARRSAGATA